MRLYGAIQKVEAQDDGTVRVHGIATSEAVDDQGEIVRADAIRAAIPDYMHFPALREMHQLSAAGTTLEAEVCDDGTTRIVAHVVDPVAVAKVKNQVYRGFSIGGRVTQRDPRDPKTITGLVLNEISLVDRPANPEAIFDCWKAAVATAAFPPKSMGEADPLLARAPFNPPIQIWACGASDHRHLAKAEALRCIQERDAGQHAAKTAISAKPAGKATPEDTTSAPDEPKNPIHPATSVGNVQYADPGYQIDRKKRYPVDTDRHIRAAWGYINKPSNARRYTHDQLRRIRATIIAAWKAKIDKDGPPSAEDHERASEGAMTKAFWDICHVARVITELDWLKDALELEAAIENDDSTGPARLQAIIAELCDFLNALVNEETSEILGETDDGALQTAPAMFGMPDDVTGAPLLARVAALALQGKPKMRKLAGLLAKADDSDSDQALMDMAHRCLSELTEGASCCTPVEVVSAHSTNNLQHLQAAHDHLVSAGAKCDGVGVAQATAPITATQKDLEPMEAKSVHAADLTKALADERDETAAVAKVLREIVPMLERLTKRVDDIARTPLPPLTIAKGAISVAKQQDRSAEPELSSEAVAGALAKMSKEEQTLALIKASYANPIRTFGSNGDEQ